MFYCERAAAEIAAEVAKLTDEQREAGFTAYLNDYVRVVYHYLRDPSYPWDTRTPRPLRDACLQRRAVDLDTLSRVCAQVIFELEWRQGGRPLTPDEAEILAAAWRLSDSIHGPRS